MSEWGRQRRFWYLLTLPFHMPGWRWPGLRDFAAHVRASWTLSAYTMWQIAEGYMRLHPELRREL